MFARVIVNHTSHALDKTLEYEIPADMTVEIGDAVTVPFGQKNRPAQGYVVGIEAKPEFDSARIKKIKSKSALGRAFDENMLEVIRFMRQRYMCSFSEAAATVVPAGAAIKVKEWLVGEEYSGELSGRKQELYSIVSEEGAVEYTVLASRFEWDCSQVIRELVSMGAIRREFSEKAPVEKKTQLAVRLCVSEDEALDAVAKMQKKAPKRAKALNVMINAKVLTYSDLRQFAECDNQAINALCKNGLLEKTEVEIERNPNTQYVKPDSEKPLTPEQKDVVGKIAPFIENKKQQTFLLHGVTGSGKTEVYMHCIRKVTDMGRKAIVLVPEISLTPQTVNRFKARFGDRIAVIHSALSMGERFDQWRKIRDGGADIIIGARSAVFAPLDNIGIIILDEEHSDTYKSETSPRYVTEEIAAFRAAQYGAVVLLASATPSFKSYHRAELGEIQLLTMEKRYNMNSMPEISIQDMREELKNGNKSMFSIELQREIRENLSRGEQTILFMNRRGFSTFVSCRECGYVAHCPNCNISMTYHKYDNTLQCHYCGHTVSNYDVCPSCGSKYIRYFGGGTEKVENEIKQLFPEATTIRMDIDTTGKKQSHRKILDRFEKEKIDILIGTQMVTKGLDFENVTLVGVVSADTMLNIDDFRSGERTFGILEQVTGRAGRGNKKGRAIIQTYSPDHEAVIMAAYHNYKKYYHDEMRLRKILWYPPFCNLVLIGFSGPVRKDVEDCAKIFAATLGKGDFKVMGPLPCAVSKIKNKYRFQILIKSPLEFDMTEVLLKAKSKCDENLNFENVTVVIDKNPTNIH